MWTVFTPFPSAQIKKCDAGKKFIPQPKLRYGIAYTSRSHYNEIVLISTNYSLSPPNITYRTVSTVYYYLTIKQSACTACMSLLTSY